MVLRLRARMAPVLVIAGSWTAVLMIVHLNSYLLVQDLISLEKVQGTYPLLPDLAGTTIIGLLGGFIGGAWLVGGASRFNRHESYLRGILRATGVFTTFFLLTAAALLFLLAFSAALVNPADVGALSVGWQNVKVNLLTPSVLTTMLLWGGLVAGTQFILQVNQKFGAGVLPRMLTGRYRNPQEEERIFMFLDLKASTAIAERLGPRLYFELLRDLFRDATTPIVECGGEIYQYVGDEIVISWPIGTGLADSNCLRCFYMVESALLSLGAQYEERYGIAPAFKAGVHIGSATVGEIGVVKRDIVYSGDVLNTTARIQAECNRHRAGLLASRRLIERLDMDGAFHAVPIGDISLRGKSDPMELCLILPA